ncbi:MAG: NRDE family protein [Burkholderiaceae bacterium]
MCLVAFALNSHPAWPLIVLANRDEWLTRPSADAAWWPDAPDCFGGRDLEAGGSWMLLNRRGRLVVLTNDPRGARAPGQRSRGELVTGLARHPGPLEPAMAELVGGDARYAGFHLLAIDWRNGRPYAMVASNTSPDSAAVRLDEGVHTLTNAPLDTPWRKANGLGRTLAAGLGSAQALPIDAWLRAMATDRWPNPDSDSDISKRSVMTPAEPAGPLALPFVAATTPSGYGTRVSSIVAVDHAGGIRFDEWHWAPAVSPPRWSRRIATRRQTHAL